MSQTNRWEATIKEASKVRLDQYLVKALPQFSRSVLQKCIQEEKVCLNQKIVKKAGTKVSNGDHISLEIPTEPEKQSPIPEDIPLEILYQDSVMAVINKPSGMVVHEGTHCTSGTLVNALLHHLDSLSDLYEERPGIVHRLDQETSGVILVAKTNEAHLHLSAQFEQRNVQKQYLALVRGKIPKEEFEVNQPLGRNPKIPTKRCVLENGKSAFTAFKRIECFEKFTLVHAFPKTGRTHQIRVHLHYFGFPLVGEKLYSKDSSNLLSHHALHAEKITFQHPTSSKPMSFSASPPQDFQQLLEKLR